MSKSSGGGLSIGTFIFICFLAYGIFGDDDDKDKKTIDVNVEVETEGQIISQETRKEVEKSMDEIVTSAKKAYDEVKKDFDKHLKEGEKIDETQDQKTAEEKVVERREEKVETLKPMEPMEDKPEKEVKFKRL